MITTVKNTQGFKVCLLLFFCATAYLSVVVFFGYFTDDVNLKKQWFLHAGVLAMSAGTLHQMILIFKKVAYTRLKNFHGFAVTGYILILLTSIIVPLFFDDSYRKLPLQSQSLAVVIFCLYGFSIIVLLFFLISIIKSNDQIVQLFLHPYTEIIDGFAKSSGSIQMTKIPSTNSSLKQVVVDGSIANKSTQSINISTKDTAGKSTKLSTILKMWPKAESFPVRALYSFKSTVSSELPFKKGDSITVLDCRGRWWQAQKDDRIGFIPSNYVSVNQKASVISSYISTDEEEVSVTKDQIVEVMEIHEEKCLVRNVEGKIGSVPTNRLELLKII